MPHVGGYLVIFKPFGNISVLHGSCVEHLLIYHLVVSRTCILSSCNRLLLLFNVFCSMNVFILYIIFCNQIALHAVFNKLQTPIQGCTKIPG